MFPPDRFPERELHLDWINWLTRSRRTIYAVLAVLYVASFNGFWRVGADSALYRGLARSLARGDGYIFAGEHHRHAYPGLPWILAVLDRIFGDTPVPGLVLMTLLALATLWLVDRLISLRYPIWVAVLVTAGLALNVRFIRQSQQLMTDVPFTFGVFASLYALERLRLAPLTARWPTFAGWGAALLAAMGVAAATRPTFGVLAIAIVVASAVRCVRNTDGRRWLHGSILAGAVIVILGLFLVDPRTRGLSPLQGVYEQELVDRVKELPHTLLGQLHSLLGRDLNDAFFSQRFTPVGYVVSLVLLASSVLVLRRDLVWGLMIFGLIAITLPLSTVPRYFLMVMPLMWVGWIVLCSGVALRLPAKVQGWVLGAAMILPLAVNGVRSIDFVIEQRAPDVAWLLHGENRETAFYAKYREGIILKQRAIADMIAKNTTTKQTIIGPDAHVLAYYSDRRVIGERTLFIDREAALSQWPAIVAKANPDLAIFPISAYGESDALMRDLIRRRIMVAGDEVARIDGALLAAAWVRLPPPGVNWKSWRGQIAVPRMIEVAGTGTGTTRATVTKRMSTTQRAEMIAKREHKAERDARQKRIEKAQRQAKLEKIAKAQKQAQRDRIAKREKAQKRDRIERRQKLERRGNPAGAPASAPAIAR